MQAVQIKSLKKKVVGASSSGAKNLGANDRLVTSNGAKTLCTLDSLLMFGMVLEVFGGGLEVFGECSEVVWEVLHNW